MFKKILQRQLPWSIATFLMIPLIVVIHYILHLGFNADKVLGIIGVLVLFSFSLFFFLRRSLLFYVQTVVFFYLFAIVSSLLLIYIGEGDLFGFIILFQVFGFYKIMTIYSTFNESGKCEANQIEIEQQTQKWYQKILSTKTEQKVNKAFLMDFFIFITVLLLILFIMNRLG